MFLTAHDLCNRRNDSKILSTITWYEATHTEGCYAINAAQNDGGCKACVSEEVASGCLCGWASYFFVDIH